ncbi:LysR substrate-binding domain-containing protein, partial [Microbacterium tenebrionis]|uniref:LysR substrate-binding domain-containing protein n=1 Tax=Microbacterium tenebrionis TaxID=2830665 RepID=UPI0034A222EE
MAVRRRTSTHSRRPAGSLFAGNRGSTRCKRCAGRRRRRAAPRSAPSGSGARRDGRGIDTPRSRELTVAASQTVSAHMIPAWLVALRDRQVRAGRAPTAVRLMTVNSTEVEVLVHEGTADLGFIESSAVPAGLSRTTVRMDALTLVVAPSRRRIRGLGGRRSRSRRSPTPNSPPVRPAAARVRRGRTRCAGSSGGMPWRPPSCCPHRLPCACRSRRACPCR